MTPLRPSSMIHAYAPTKGADMVAMTMHIRRSFAPRILNTDMK